ncbi:hypothetical protein [Klebsiella pneumoniae]|nr:hypothetical protein [Klebsiella pneumoniae]
MQLEHRFELFEIKSFGFFPENEQMTVKDYLRAVFGVGEYITSAWFNDFYAADRKGLILHVKHRHTSGMLYDYYFIGDSVGTCMEMLANRFPFTEQIIDLAD